MKEIVFPQNEPNSKSHWLKAKDILSRAMDGPLNRPMIKSHFVKLKPDGQRLGRRRAHREARSR